MKRGMIYLIIAIPLASVVMGAVTLYLALSEPDVAVRQQQPTLSRTNWRGHSESEQPGP